MTKTDFLEALSVVEQDLFRRGLSLAQIEVVETDALALTRGDDYMGPREYICTVQRLANSGLF